MDEERPVDGVEERERERERERENEKVNRLYGVTR